MQKKTLMIILPIVVILLIIGVSYALYSITLNTDESEISLGTVVMTYSEKTNGIELTDAMPISNEIGSSLSNYFDFEVTGAASKAGVEFNYVISMTPDASNTLDSSNVVLYLTDGVEGNETIVEGFEEYPLASYFYKKTSNREDSYILHEDTITTVNKDEVVTDTYRLRMWVKEDASMSSGMAEIYKIKINVDAVALPLGETYTKTTYIDTTLNGADPELDYSVLEQISNNINSYQINNLVDYIDEDNEKINQAAVSLNDVLIPVVISDNGEVNFADIYGKWYDYEEKWWANAVILKDGRYVNEDGSIDLEDIESYFVWIPRYRYELFAPSNYATVTNSKPTGESIADTINIIFEDKEVAPSVESSGWITHPAFTSFDVNGLWVGKFETTGSTSELTVLPSAISLRNQTVKTMFDSAYTYSRDNDSHMMKNTEWGAVAYLSHSKYGINKEVNINNHFESITSDRLTGYSAVTTTDQSDHPGTYGTASTVTQPYNTETGYLASTTGNISGVYDMSGGASEYMAAYMSGGTFTNSGFTTTTLDSYDNKYFDVYAQGSTVSSYQNRILGDATGELGPFYRYADGDATTTYHNNWYADFSGFVDSTNSWFLRGGYFGGGILSGQFSFYRNTGVASATYGFRLILAI